VNLTLPMFQTYRGIVDEFYFYFCASLSSDRRRKSSVLCSVNSINHCNVGRLKNMSNTLI